MSRSFHFRYLKPSKELQQFKKCKKDIRRDNRHNIRLFVKFNSSNDLPLLVEMLPIKDKTHLRLTQCYNIYK